ncbi:MAG: hypothetical protein HF973_03155 [Chloroflexi bacterium]|nr:hypothetical protein [Chloroflexota bacterium]
MKTFEKAKTFMTERARPLESVLFAYHFENGRTADVLTELSRYQNEDGGFGRALEPDFRYAGSSVLATSVALQTLRQLDVSAAEPLVQGAMRYLLKNLDETRPSWYLISKFPGDVPSAPWWHGYVARVPDGFLANPTAEITGYLWEYPTLAPEDVRLRLTEVSLAHLEQAEEMDMFTLPCYLRLFQTPSLLPDVKKQMEVKLRELLGTAVAPDPAAWEEYVFTPLHAADSPDSPFAGMFDATIQANLDYLIQSQADDGSWPPPWSWGDFFADTWAQVRQEWAGILTLHNLHALRNFGRL